VGVELRVAEKGIERVHLFGSEGVLAVLGCGVYLRQREARLIGEVPLEQPVLRRRARRSA
jgi:hypothetical protein